VSVRMVQEGGAISAYGAFAPGAKGSHGQSKRSTSATSLGSAVIMCLAMVGLLAVASMEEGSVGRVELAQKEQPAVHDLHFANSLKPEEAKQQVANDAHAAHRSQAITGDAAHSTPQERLVQARMQAENRIRQAKAKKQVSAESKEEALLRKQLDAEVKLKQRGELKAAMSKSDLSFLKTQEKGATKAKDLKVKVTNVNSGPDGDQSEEAALRKQLNAQAKREQEQLLEKQDPQLKGLQDSAVASASKLAKHPQVSESQLEAQLRAQLNAKVHKEKEGMFKTAVTQWLSKDVGIKPKAAAPAATATTAKAATATKTAKHGGSLAAAEQIMKASLEQTKVSAHDTTLQHRPLSYKAAQTAAKKTSGLEALEQAMLKSTLQESKQEMPALRNKHKMMAQLRQAAKAKAQKEKEAKPSYQDAMLKFSKRLVTTEHSEKQEYNKDTVALRHQFAEATKSALENSIKDKVQAQLTLGNPKLQQERATLLKEFGNAKSLFAKTEQAELKSLQAQQQRADASALSSSTRATPL